MVVAGLLLAVIIYFAAKMTLLKKEKKIDVMTKGKEMGSIAVSMGVNLRDPFTDFFEWYLGIRICGSKRSSGYLLLVVVAFVLAMLSVRISIKQLNFLSGDEEGEEGFSDANMDATFLVLKEKYKSVYAVLSRLGLATVVPAQQEEEEDTPVQDKEEKLLANLIKAKKLMLDISRRERKEERVTEAVRQLYFEDVPFTIMNLLYVVYRCEHGEETNGVQVMFLFRTVVSVALGAKKYFEWKQVQADRKNVEWWVEIVAIKLAESKTLLREIKEIGGDEDGNGEIEECRSSIIGEPSHIFLGLLERRRHKAVRKLVKTEYNIGEVISIDGRRKCSLSTTMKDARTCAFLVFAFAAFLHWFSGTQTVCRDEFQLLVSGSGWNPSEIQSITNNFFRDDECSAISLLMINFVKLRDVPFYGDRLDLKPSWVKTGKDADEHYGTQFLSKLIFRAGFPIFFSENVALAVLSPADFSAKQWDYFAVVRYRSLRDFAENVHEMGDTMAVLKHSGVEETYLVPVFSGHFDRAVLGFATFLLFLGMR